MVSLGLPTFKIRDCLDQPAMQFLCFKVVLAGGGSTTVPALMVAIKLEAFLGAASRKFLDGCGARSQMWREMNLDTLIVEGLATGGISGFLVLFRHWKEGM